MKKTIFTIVAFVLAVVVCFAIAYCTYDNGNEEIENYNGVVEDQIAEDKAYMDTVPCDKYVFYECRVTMPQPFNEMDEFVAEEITNVYQTYKHDSLGGGSTDVYMFIHKLNFGTVVDIHRGAFMVEDLPLDFNEIAINFAEAFHYAKESNFVPSKSKYVTLRKPLIPKITCPYYIYGNGQLWVEADNGEVSDKDPMYK